MEMQNIIICFIVLALALVNWSNQRRLDRLEQKVKNLEIEEIKGNQQHFKL